MDFNAHIKNFPKRAAINILREQYRELKDYLNDVKKELSNKNIYDCDRQKVMDDIQKAIEITEQNDGKKIRKDRAVLCSVAMSVPSSWDDISEQKYYEMQKKVLQNLLKKRGCESEIHVVIHRDEGREIDGIYTPHRHATMTFVPLKDGKTLNRKAIITPSFLKEMQSKMYDEYVQFSSERPHLEVMNPPKGRGRTHKSEVEYKDYKQRLKEQKLNHMIKSAEDEKARLKGLKEPETGGVFRKDYVSKKDYETLYKTAEKLAETVGILKEKVSQKNEEMIEKVDKFQWKIQELRDELNELRHTDTEKLRRENNNLREENQNLSVLLESERDLNNGLIRENDNLKRQVYNSRNYERSR